jgi:phytoene synthase
MTAADTLAAADLAHCRELLRNGSRTFLAASLLLPRAVCAPACALYAFCRVADDAIDAAGRAHDALDRLKHRLDRAYAAAPLPHPVDRALARVVGEFAIPRALPEALLEGFAWDAEGRQYDSFEALSDYAARVAGSVGAMMALLMGARDAESVARACDLGVAMQLSNIARDVGDDARAGRLYLPRDWMREASIDPDAWLARPTPGAALASVVDRLLRAADAAYARAASGVGRLPPACRPAIHAARMLYAEIGHEVRRRGLNPVDARAVVPAPRKLLRLAQAVALPRPSRAGVGQPPLAATRFLVDAVLRCPAPRAEPPPAWWRMGARLVRTIELFERLERVERSAGAA